MAEPKKASEVEPEAAKPPTVKSDLPLGHQRVKLTDVMPSDRNPRRGSVADLVEALREFGQHRDAVVQQSTGKVIIGNHMYLAAKTLGWDEIDINVVDDDETKALRRATTDNAVGDKATYDEAELAEILEEVGPVPGFDDDDIAKLLKRVTPDVPDPDNTPTYPLVARMNEHHDYVVIVCKTETDWSWLQTKLQLRQEKSYKSTAVGMSHVVSVERFQELTGEA